MLGVICQRPQMIGVADGRDRDAVLAGARNDGVQRRHGNDGAKPAPAIHAEEIARCPFLVAGRVSHRQAHADALDYPAQAQQAVAGDGAHLRFQEETGLGPGMFGRHAIGEQDALGQFADVLDGDQHGSNIL